MASVPISPSEVGVASAPVIFLQEACHLILFTLKLNCFHNTYHYYTENIYFKTLSDVKHPDVHHSVMKGNVHTPIQDIHIVWNITISLKPHTTAGLPATLHCT